MAEGIVTMVAKAAMVKASSTVGKHLLPPFSFGNVSSADEGASLLSLKGGVLSSV